MTIDLAASYRIRLRSLQWVSSFLRQLSHSADEDAVTVAANWAVGAVYDLSEAYWALQLDKIKSTASQDAHFESFFGGETVGGLLVARAKMTHELVQVSSISSLRNLPYDFAKLTDWAWAAPAWKTGDRLDKRTEWYRQHVSRRPLWVPIEAAEWWFTTNGPEFATGEAVIAPESWVKGIAPVFFNADEVGIARQLRKTR